MHDTDVIDPDGVMAHELSDRLRALGAIIGRVNVANGWDTSRAMVADPESYDDRWLAAHKVAELGLISTEASEAIEEVRHGHAMTETYYRTPNGSALSGESARDMMAELFGQAVPKPEGVPSELADVVIRAADLADAYGIDLGAAIVEKLNHNATRGRHHGGKAL